MDKYLVKKPSELSETEIQAILLAWDVEEWKALTLPEFRKRFEDSEFHLLTGEESKLLSIARINFRFSVKIKETDYKIAELVGFVAVEILQGYGKFLLKQVADNLSNRKIEAIGFCKRRTSPFYETNGFKVLHGKVKHLREKINDQWFTPTEDDDIVSLTLSEQTLSLFDEISDEEPAYLLF